MDVQVCAILSVIETVGTVGVNESRSLASTPKATLTKTFLCFFLLQYIVLKICRIFIYPVFFSPLRHLPTPEGNHFMVGQIANQFRASSPNELYLKWARHWPDAPFVRYYGFANKESLLVNGIEAHREVFQTYCYSFTKPGFFNRFVGEIAGTGLLFSEGDEHRKQRKLILNTFSIPNLKKMLPVFQEKAKDLTRYLDDQMRQNPTGTVEVQHIYSKATIDIIGVTALGVELRNLKSERLRLDFLQCYRRMFDQSYFSALISFINVHVPVRRLLWFVPANRGFVEATQEIRSMLRQCIRDRIRDVGQAQGAEAKFQSRDLLTYMIEERLTGKDALTIEEILGHLLNFLSAGHETTAGSMTWATYVMATIPEVQDKLRAEIMALLKEKPQPDYSDIERMRYMHNFVRELLRLYSPAVGSHREAATDVVICGTRIPKGTNLVLCPSVTNLSPRIWGPDVDEFIPERWDRLQGEAATPYSVMTFINGPRQCIGKQYAYTEIKALLIEVVSRFRFRPSEELERNGMKVELRNPGVVLRPRDGLLVRLERI